MENVLIVSSGEKGKDSLSELFRPYALSRITVLSGGGEVRRALLESEFDLIVINAPLSDEFGDELAEMCAQDTMSGVILIVRAEMCDEVAQKVEDAGVFVFPKPISRQFFYQTLKLVEAAHRRLLSLRDENTRLQRKIEENRLIDRAKCTLIQYLSMTEAQAHRYIEKQAMDMRIKRAEVAQAILNAYEN